ncbi:hypothetical protein RHA65_04740 [Providencia rettgeri]|uniref:tail fiber/spike domain-containing protein n=1 Tax=Providencia rettgeri TaxID=587 RepID=UPI001B37F3B0|nr:hypothetical protein [Providencia rettgeri]MBQ0207795.1 hypothetical protein [Providencia rettgeri]MDR9613991.1 hypothetical protein [Providencia rettgeri]
MREVKPTQKPVPSSDIKDLFFNSGLLDIWATSLEHKYIDRFGNCHLTAAGMEWLFKELVETFKVDMNTAIVAAGYITVDSFQQGADLPNNEITLRNHILRDEATGEYYRWDGDLPKLVTAGSTPQSAGGIGKGAWVSVGDASLRGDIGKVIKTYSNVEQLVNDITIREGQIVETLGFYNDGDGGGARYKATTDKEVNGFTVIQGNGVALELLDINMKSMGVFDGDDAKPCIQFCVDNNIKIHDSGSYKLSSSVVLPDHYFEITGKPLFDGGSTTTRLFYHTRKEEKEVSLLTNYLNTGNYICQLSSDEIPVGAIVRFVSNRHITEFWTSEVIRDYYNWGEINKVIAKNGNMYTFEVPFYFNYRPSEMKSVSWYLPREGCKLDIRVRCDKSEVFNGNTGVEIWQCDDNVTIDIESEGFNSNGLLVGQCWKPTISTVFSIGGNDLSERNYGINIADGTRGFSVGLVQGINNRHAFTGGGSGRAIPMEGSVDTIIHTNPSKTSAGLHGPDTHANAASFTIGKCISDTTCSFSGIGHIINSAECNGGYMTFANEGGFNISYGTVHVKNPERLYPGISVMKSSYIGRLSIQITKFIPEQQLSINKDNGSLEIESLFFENQAIAGVTSNEAANEIAAVHFIIRGNVAINTASLTGVPMLMLVGDGCSIQKLKLTDCGWGDVNTVHFYGNKNVSINSIVTNHSNGSLTYPVTSRLIGFNQSAGVTHSGITISNLSGYSKKGRVIDVGSNVSSSMFISNNLYGVSSFNAASQSIVANWRGI